MVDFSNEHKEEMGGQRFEQGVHEVVITKVALESTKDGKELIKFSLEGTGGEEGEAVLWFTTDKAIKYTFNTIKSIFVHNVEESKKESTRKKFDTLKNTDELEKAINKVLIGGTAFYTVYENPERTYEKDGETKNSYDKNIYGYRPKERNIAPATVQPVNEPATQSPEAEQVPLAEGF